MNFIFYDNPFNKRGQIDKAFITFLNRCPFAKDIDISQDIVLKNILSIDLLFFTKWTVTKQEISFYHFHLEVERNIKTIVFVVL